MANAQKFNKEIKPSLILIPLLVIGAVYLVWWWLHRTQTVVSQLGANNQTGAVPGNSPSYNVPPVQEYNVTVDPVPAFDPKSLQLQPGTAASGIPTFAQLVQDNGGSHELAPYSFGPSYGPNANIPKSALEKAVYGAQFSAPKSDIGVPGAGNDSCGCGGGCDSDCKTNNTRFVAGQGACMVNDPANTLPDNIQKAYEERLGDWINQSFNDVGAPVSYNQNGGNPYASANSLYTLYPDDNSFYGSGELN